MTDSRTLPTTPPAASGTANDDLGLSGVFEAESRYLDRTGRFTSRRIGLGWAAYNPYTVLLSLSWPSFFLFTLSVYLFLNGFFAVIYYLLGPAALSESPNNETRLLADFFFSVQTFGTIGFGHVYPATLAANVAVTLEAFVGLLAVALLTGMLFARFARPSQRILFSDHAVIAPYRGGQGLMFRMVNGHRTDLSDVNVEVVATMHRTGETGRQFFRLILERDRVTLFPLAWTVVHPLDKHSPFYGLSREGLIRQEVELIAIVRAVDDIAQQPIQARTSYHAREILWNEKFSSMYVRDGGRLAVDARLLHATQPVDQS